MLVLTRKVGESIQINDDVKITVIEVKGKNFRLGIDAPKTTKVYREEVFLKIQEENKIASSTPAGFDPGKITDIISDNFTFVGSKSDSTGEAQYDNQSQKSDDFNQSVSSNQDDDVPF